MLKTEDQTQSFIPFYYGLGVGTSTGLSMYILCIWYSSSFLSIGSIGQKRVGINCCFDKLTIFKTADD